LIEATSFSIHPSPFSGKKRDAFLPPKNGEWGFVGSLIGTFGGYQARTRLTRGLKVNDIFIAILEDLVAIGFAYFLVSRG